MTSLQALDFDLDHYFIADGDLLEIIEDDGIRHRLAILCEKSLTSYV